MRYNPIDHINGRAEKRQRMKKFVGLKKSNKARRSIIKAKRMTKKEYEEYRSMKLRSLDDEDKEGYLVGYPQAYNKFEGTLEGGCHFLSWYSKDVFESTYKPLDD